MNLCYRNGVYLPLDEVSIPVTDLLVQRGIGVFDSIRTYDGRPFALREHLRRLETSAREAAMELPLSQEELEAIIREGVRRVGGEVTVRPYVTGGRSIEPSRFPKPEIFILFEATPPLPAERYEKGVSLLPIPFSRAFPAMKSIDYMVPYVSRLRAGGGDFECLYCPDGTVTESTAGNFFLVFGETIVTAPDEAALEGVTRAVVIELAREAGLDVEKRLFRLEEIEGADEAFITGTVKEVTPVVRVGSATIGKGCPGPVTAKLHGLLRDHISRWLD